MKKLLVFLLAFQWLNTNGQKASISEKSMRFKTYDFSDPNPVPEFGRIYPYFTYEGYSATGVEKEWKIIEMENDFIKVWIMPDIGGKIWGAVEKSTGKEFIYFNHSVKFRDIAMRGPWTSGGIEINFGIIGHTPAVSTPVDYTFRDNDDGSVSCFVGALDLTSHTRWSVEVNLPRDKAYFTTNTVWHNPTLLEQSYYHWMNLGVKTKGNLEYIFPGNKYLGHNGENSSWPVDSKGRDLSHYENNNFGGSKSYHVFGQLTDFYGAYWHDDDFGFVHYSPYDEKPGKKVFLWGLSEQGMIWEYLLTDTDGQYTEIQSGRLYNQASPGSSSTPFKNTGFSPGLTDEWTEYWFPVKGTSGVKSALPAGSVNMLQKDDVVTLWFCPNEKVEGQLELRNGSNVLLTKNILTTPMVILKESINYTGDFKNLTVWLDNILIYDANSEKYQIKRPVDVPEDFNQESIYAHFVKGKEWEYQRNYKRAEEEYRKALDIDKWYLPALSGMANISYRKNQYRDAFEYSGKALSINTYDPEANMLYGISGLALGDTTSAIDGFSLASRNISHRCPAYNALASIFLNKGDPEKALSYAERSLSYNKSGTYPIQQKLLCLRKLGNKDEFEKQLKELEITDPLNHFIRFEKFIIDPSGANESLVKKFITNELPQETYLEYAIWYYQNGQINDALKVLGLAPDNQPVVLFWQAYLNHLIGDEKAGSDALTRALRLSPKMVFPFRPETSAALEWAGTQSDNWKIKYYVGLTFLSAGSDDKGKAIWETCGEEPDFYPFYIARSRLYETSSPNALADMERALELSGNDWQAGLIASKFYQKIDFVKSEALAKNYYARFPDNFGLGLQYARTLESNKKYNECVNLLKKLQILPYEGASEGRVIWRRANLELARGLIKSGKYRKALENIELARQWPINLGVGKPYQTDVRTEDELSLECYEKLKDEKSEQVLREK